jgi:hypothetical protein
MEPVTPYIFAKAVAISGFQLKLLLRPSKKPVSCYYKEAIINPAHAPATRRD